MRSIEAGNCMFVLSDEIRCRMPWFVWHCTNYCGPMRLNHACADTGMWGSTSHVICQRVCFLFVFLIVPIGIRSFIYELRVALPLEPRGSLLVRLDEGILINCTCIGSFHGTPIFHTSYATIWMLLAQRNVNINTHQTLKLVSPVQDFSWASYMKEHLR